MARFHLGLFSTFVYHYGICIDGVGLYSMYRENGSTMGIGE